MNHTKQILVMDDDPCACACLSDMIRFYGFTVECVSSCQSARHRLGEKKYDGLLLDLWMPDGTGGELLTWLRANGRNEPVVVMSEDADYDQYIDLVNKGAADLIPKPVESKPLKRALQLAMGNDYFSEQKNGWQPMMGV